MLSSPAKAVIESGRVALWFAKPEETKALVDQYESLLSHDEYERYQAINLPDFRLAYLVSRVLLRCALSHYFSAKPDEWRFSRNEFGKPVLSDEHQLAVRFNTAHTEGLSVCAISVDTDIGVDVECYTGSEGYMELAEQHFSDIEFADLNSRPAEEQAESFFKYWTLKESYIKAKGQGTSSVPLKSFSFRFADNPRGAKPARAQVSNSAVNDRKGAAEKGVFFIPPLDHAKDRDWSFKLMTGNHQYMLALASSSTINSMQYVHCIPELQAQEIPSFDALFDEPLINTYATRI